MTMGRYGVFVLRLVTNWPLVVGFVISIVLVLAMLTTVSERPAVGSPREWTDGLRCGLPDRAGVPRFRCGW